MGLPRKKSSGKTDSSYMFPELIALRRFKRDKTSVFGVFGIMFLLTIAVAAPLIANGRPFLIYKEGNIFLPALRFIFAPDSTEVVVEKFFNFLLLFSPCALVICLFLRNKRNLKWKVAGFLAVITALPFILVPQKLDKRDWRKECSKLGSGGFAVFAPVPYGPSENISTPFGKPDSIHIFGADQVGRDVFSRMVYGARVSLAVGVAATGITMIIGIIVGMISGYFGGKTDLFAMRIVEIIMCFPTFLLLLILMAMMMDYKFKQSILLVIGVIGLTSWTGLSRIVRGEVLRQRAMSYVRSCESLGVPVWRIMLFHLLPNVAGPILVSFTFGVAGAILAESGLSFLGFGVQPPTASWGELLRQAFSDPLRYWHLTLWPGAAIFIAVISFNFAGEGLHRAFDPKNET